MKKEFKALSDSEREIMDLFWKQGRTMLFAEILAYFNQEKNKGWKKQALSVFLQRLIDKDMLVAVKKGRICEYTVKKQCSEYEQEKVENILEKQFLGSMQNFISAFYYGKPITKEEKEELKSWIENLEEE